MIDRIYLLDAPEHIISNVTSGHRVFRVFQHHTPSLRRPSHGWSNLAVGIYYSSWISSPDPEPSWGFLCFLGGVLNGSSPLYSGDAQCTQGLVDWLTCRPSAANLDGQSLAFQPCLQLSPLRPGGCLATGRFWQYAGGTSAVFPCR